MKIKTKLNLFILAVSITLFSYSVFAIPPYPFKNSALLKTGQTTSYVNYDDGYYQKGISKSYTVLTTGQYSLTTNITINSKTDVHSNACVLDNNTGLMWSQTVSASVGPGSNGKLPWTTTGSGATAEGIFPYCAAANVALLGGYGDWRIPNSSEISSIRNIENTRSVPDTTAFVGFPAAQIWGSSSSKSSGAPFYFNFTLNGAEVAAIGTASYQTILVRGG